MMIFFLIITFAYWSMIDAVDQSISSERQRQLVMLAQRKLGEIAIFERHFDENLGPEGFDDLPDEMRDDFEGWEWQLDVTDVTTFGPPKDNAPGLFETTDTKGAQTGTDTADTSAQSAKKGEAQVIRQLTLKVWAPGDDGGEGDSIEIVTYLPQIAAKTAAGSKPAGDAPK